MKSLTSPQVKGLIHLVVETRDREFDCTQCQQHVSEFAEQRLAGLPLSEALASVEHHLTVCPECREEFAALEQVLRAGDELLPQLSASAPSQPYDKGMSFF